MTRRGQLRLYFHGVIFLLAAMLIGGPGLSLALTRGWTDQVRQFLRQSHLILMLTGLWLLASGPTLSLIDATDRVLSFLVWSLVVSGYTFIVSVAVFGLVFVLESQSGPYSTQWEQLTAAPYHLRAVYLLFLGANGVASLAAALTLVQGAHKALRQSIVEAVR